VWQSQPLPARQDQGDAIDDGNNLYWISRGRQLLIATLLHVVTDLTREHHTLTEVRRLVNSAAANPEGFAEVFARSRHPEVRAIAGNLQIKADSTLGGILSFAQEGVDFMRGPALQAAVERTSFDLDRVVRGEPLTIYIVLPPHMLNSHGRFLRLWISALMSLIMRRRSRPEKSTLFILDEAAQLGPLNELRTAVTLMRGYGLQTWTFWQDLSQLGVQSGHLVDRVEDESIWL
jgi:type IV secretion system protein VirD4